MRATRPKVEQRAAAEMDIALHLLGRAPLWRITPGFVRLLFTWSDCHIVILPRAKCLRDYRHDARLSALGYSLHI